MKLSELKQLLTDELDAATDENNCSGRVKAIMHSVNLPFNWNLVDTIILMTNSSKNIKLLDAVSSKHLVTLK